MVAKRGVDSFVERGDEHHTRQQHIEQVVDCGFVGAGTRTHVLAKFFGRSDGGALQRVEREYRTGVFGFTQVGESRTRIVDVVDDHCRNRLAECRLHCCPPVMVDVNEVEQRADAAGRVAQGLSTKRLRVDRCLQRFDACRTCRCSARCSGVRADRFVERVLRFCSA